jgi:hypothetical protein
VLSRNEVDRDYAYNRALFKRVAHGLYQFNPALSVRRRQGETEEWLPIFQALNLPFYNEFTWVGQWPDVHHYLEMAGLPPPATPIAARHWDERRHAAEKEKRDKAAKLAKEGEARERRMARMRERTEARMEEYRRQQEEAKARMAQTLAEAKETPPAKPARWGTPEAKQAEIERIRREIEERARKEKKQT